MHVEENSRAAGAEMAISYGEQIAAGLEKRLNVLGDRVEPLVERFEWMTVLKWGAGVGLGIVLTILIAVYALTPHLSGLTDREMSGAIAELIPCEVDGKRHICIKLDEKPKLSKGPDGAPLGVVRGL